MTDYELVIHLRESVDPTRIPMPGVSEQDAEGERQALLYDVDQARLAEVPILAVQTKSGLPREPIPISPQDITGIDLVEAESSDG